MILLYRSSNQLISRAHHKVTVTLVGRDTMLVLVLFECWWHTFVSVHPTGGRCLLSACQYAQKGKKGTWLKNLLQSHCSLSPNPRAIKGYDQYCQLIFLLVRTHTFNQGDFKRGKLVHGDVTLTALEILSFLIEPNTFV